MPPARSPLVQRFCLHASPLATNRVFRPHETANLVVFIREETLKEGQRKLADVLSRERWRALNMEVEDRLVEGRVRENGGEVWKAYQHALQHGDWIKVFPDHFGAGKANDFDVRGPRLDEAFIDKVILKAGGKRYVPPGPENCRTSNADYLIDELVLELKDIQENALAKASRQKRLAALMRKAGHDQPTVRLDPDLLQSAEAQQVFWRILGEPFARAIKSASKQIQKTREALGSPDLRGGVILLNTGTHIYSHEILVETSRLLACKPGRIIDEVFCFTTAFHSNGFDRRVDFAAYPEKATNPLQERILGAFWSSIDDFMTQWARSGGQEAVESLHPHQAVAFEDEGQTFYWLPEPLPSTLNL